VVDAWCGEMPANETEVSRRAYYANIAFVDEWIGEVLGAVEANGLANNTVVLFTSDHGDMQGDHFLWRKGYPYEASAHVPLILRPPPSFPSVVAPGSSLDFIAEMRDIYPTFLDIAGIPIPPDTVDGSSLACLLRDPTGATCGNGGGTGSLAEARAGLSNGPGSGNASGNASGSGWRTWIDLEHDIMYNASIHWSGATDGQTKYIFWALDGAEQFFNLTADPYEMTDLSAEPAYAPLIQMWRSRLVSLYEAEGRGPLWVRNGTLIPRPAGQLYSYNYPNTTLRA
jgi:arylsulfatase A-like enzyme